MHCFKFLRCIGVILPAIFQASYSWKSETNVLECECGSVLGETNPMVVFLDSIQRFCNGIRISKNHVLTSRSCYTNYNVRPPGNVNTMAMKPFEVNDYSWVRKADFDMLVLETEKALNSTEPNSGVPCLFKENASPKFPELSREDYLYTYAFQIFDDQARTKRRVFLEEKKNCPSWEQSKDNIICTKDNGTKVDEDVAMVDWYSIDMGVYPGTGLYLLKKDVSYLIGVATSGFARHGSNNQSNLIMQFVSLKGIGDHLAKVAGDCKSCSICAFHLSYNLLYCQAGTLKAGSEIALSISEECWGILSPYNDIYQLLIDDQPFITKMDMSELHRFFPDLEYLTVRRTNLTDVGVWDQLGTWKLLGQVFHRLQEINLDSNSISHVKGGSFDGIFSLEKLSLMNNSVPTIETRSWPLCFRLEKGELQIQPSGVDVVKDYDLFQPTTVEREYCDFPGGGGETMSNFVDECIIDGDDKSTLDCSTANLTINWYALPCLKTNHFKKGLTRIKIPFPKESKPQDHYFNNINCNVAQDVLKSLTRFPDANRVKSTLIFYAMDFDLRLLKYHTSTKSTKEVTIFADRVINSEPLNITYKLKIRARVVLIKSPIIMTMPLNDFIGNRSLHFKREKLIVLDDDTTLYSQQFGLVDIVEEYRKTSVCVPTTMPKTSDPKEAYLYDDLFLKLVGTCLHSKVRKDPSLTRKMAKKYLAFSDEKGFMRFRNLIYQTDNIHEKIHMVPLYSLYHLKEFVDEMVDRLRGYKTREDTKTLKMFLLSRDASKSRKDLDLMEWKMFEHVDRHKTLVNHMQESSSIGWDYFETQVSEAQAYYNNVSTNTLGFLVDSQTKVEQMMIANRKVDVLTINAEVGSAKSIVRTMKKVVQENTRQQIKYHEELKDSLKDLVNVLWQVMIQVEVESIANMVYYRARYMAEMIGVVIDTATGNLPSAAEVTSKTFDLFEKMEDVIRRTSRVMNEILGILEALDSNDSYDDFEPVFTNDLREALQGVSKMDELDDALSDFEVKSDLIYGDLEPLFKIFDPSMLKKQLHKVVKAGRDFVESVVNYSRLLLELSDKEEALNLALRRQEIILSQENIKDLNSLLVTKEKSTERLFKPLKDATKEYKDSLKRVRQDFHKASAASKEKAIRTLDQLMNNWSNSFKKFQENEEKFYDELILQIQMEIYHDEESTLDQRLLSQNLVDDICNQLFFMYFGDCSELDLPTIQDSHEERARKLSNLKWEAIQMDVKNAAHKYNGKKKRMFIKDSKIINKLKVEKTAMVNLVQQLSNPSWKSLVHFRVFGMKIFFMDDKKYTMLSSGDDFSQGAVMSIGVPQLFQDYDPDGNLHTFYGEGYTCESSYNYVEEDRRDGEKPLFGEECDKQDSYLYRNQRVTLNGYFNFTIKVPPVELERLKSLKIILSAARSVLQGKKRMKTHKYSNFSKLDHK